MKNKITTSVFTNMCLLLPFTPVTGQECVLYTCIYINITPGTLSEFLTQLYHICNMTIKREIVYMWKFKNGFLLKSCIQHVGILEREKIMVFLYILSVIRVASI